MDKSIRKMAMILVLFLGQAGCASTHYHSSETDIASVDMLQDFKVGKSCLSSFYILPPYGDASIVAAARAGGISRVAVVEREITQTIISYSVCTIVHGQ